MRGIDLLGMRFTRLVVQSEADYRLEGQRVWICNCDCGNKNIYVRGFQLRKGYAKSCGCYRNEQVSRARKKYNKYDISGEFGIGYASNTNEEFYFDLEDYDLIKNYCWIVSSTDGYLYAFDSKLKKNIVMHRLIMNFPDSLLDHKHNNRLDNRKSELRLANFSQNCSNTTLRKTSTTGIIGVTERDYGEKRKNRYVYVAAISYNGKCIHLLESKNFHDVVVARLKAEKELFGEFAPQKHLFQEYGIE